MCTHRPSCPSSNLSDSSGHPDRSGRSGRDTAHIVAAHPEQGWYLLCDGAIIFDDTGELLPDGRVVAPHRVPVGQLSIAA
ncbi:hypothetical protein G5C60_40815 [Streptomyces sp. HC44]|uniref:Uncharacterized protein n=1 Tax=Streptomyces scabichelini TaxID=2711217 RepID=A0A6G4VIH8_9ACTN|nr:DUF5999 family protein [Streptomyces scabichelini]NGO13771.1 hypothetical protein [Streptomyces scabichelini]